MVRVNRPFNEILGKQNSCHNVGNRKLFTMKHIEYTEAQFTKSFWYNLQILKPRQQSVWEHVEMYRACHDRLDGAISSRDGYNRFIMRHCVVDLMVGHALKVILPRRRLESR